MLCTKILTSVAIETVKSMRTVYRNPRYGPWYFKYCVWCVCGVCGGEGWGLLRGGMRDEGVEGRDEGEEGRDEGVGGRDEGVEGRDEDVRVCRGEG